jgi:CP family cyanate transporter-like MFS transporter
MAEASRPAAGARSRFRTLIVGASLVLIAFNMRTLITGIGPVLPEAMRDTGLTPAGAGLLTTLPSLCFGCFGPLAPALARRLGTERALLAVLVLATFGLAIRGGFGAFGLFAGQILAGIGIGVVNVLMPGLVKRDFPLHAAPMTGLYTMAICLGAAMAAGVTVPLAHGLNGWGAALSAWAVPAAAAVAIWAVQLPPRSAGANLARFTVRGLWTDALAWQVTLFVGLQASLAYIAMGWTATILRDRGLGPVEAGFALSVSIITQVPSALVVPNLIVRWRDQRASCVLVILGCLIGFFGCVYAPLGTVWLWACLMGMCLGSMLSLAMMLIVLRSPDGHVASHLSSMSQGVGYLLASLGPFLAGVLHGWSGGWNGTAFLMLAIGLGALLCGLAAGRARHVGAVSLRAAR